METQPGEKKQGQLFRGKCETLSFLNRINIYVVSIILLSFSQVSNLNVRDHTWIGSYEVRVIKKNDSVYSMTKRAVVMWAKEFNMPCTIAQVEYVTHYVSSQISHLNPVYKNTKLTIHKGLISEGYGEARNYYDRRKESDRRPDSRRTRY